MGQQHIRTLAWLGLMIAVAGCNGEGVDGGNGNGNPPPGGKVPAFDGQAAMAHLSKQVGCGPRVPGRPGHRQARDYFLKELKRYTREVVAQDFPFTTRQGQMLTLTNILARFRANAHHTLLLGAHWDTRPIAERDPQPANRNKPIDGANDGASGVAVLLEIARAMASSPPPVSVVLALFDAEDLGNTPYARDYSLGARYFARNMGNFRPDEAIVIDMIGDAHLDIYHEIYSLQAAPDLMNRVFEAAKGLGYAEDFHAHLPASFGGQVIDDHVPLIRAGIPAIDLIDFEYPDPPHPGDFWHTLQDTIDKCSALSLQAVGEVLLEVIYQRSGPSVS